jgi:hypothetical protein
VLFAAGKSCLVNKLIEKRLITSKGLFHATRIRPDIDGDVDNNSKAASSANADSSESLYLSAANFLPPSDAMPSPTALTDGAPPTSSSSFSSPSSSTSSSSSAAADESSLFRAAFDVQGGHMTSSIVPGTTLGMVSFPFVQSYTEQGQRKNPVQHVLYDTPGVINPEQMYSLLTYHELRAVMPKRQVQPLSYRLTKGQCLLLGGLARLDFVDGDRDYCFVTIFASRNVTVHLTQIDRMDALVPRGGKKKKQQQQPQQLQIGESASDPVAADASVADASATTTAAAADVDANVAAPKEGAGESVAQPPASEAIETRAAVATEAVDATEAEPEPEPELQLGYLDFVERHAGKLIYPPFSPERAKEIGLHGQQEHMLGHKSSL